MENFRQREIQCLHPIQQIGKQFFSPKPAKIITIWKHMIPLIIFLFTVSGFTLSAQTVDLELIKNLSTGSPTTFFSGDVVVFTITVSNQGPETAQNIEIIDYLPAELGLCDAASEPNGWTVSGTNLVNNIPGPLPPGTSTDIDIELCVKQVPDENAATTISNFAEITRSEDENGVEFDDIDSVPDDMNDDPISEDDHDAAEIVLLPMGSIIGCTDVNACNYDENATFDDGSCISVPICNTDPCEGDIQELSEDGCSCVIVEEQVLGCTDVNACNFNETANCDDGTCMPVPICNTDPCEGDIQELSEDGCSCVIVEEQVLGCTDVNACNFNETANCDDGSCMPVPICNTDPCEGDIQELSEDGCSCVIVEEQVLGCTDVNACNFNEAANCDDGSCMPVPVCNTDPCEGDIQELSEDGCSCVIVEEQVLGCTDINACNFNETANCDDGSCMPVPVCNTDPCEGDIQELSEDGCSCELAEEQVLGCTDITACNYNETANCNDGSCISIPVCNADPCQGDIQQLSEDFCSCELVEVQILGCTDVNACNFNEAANCDDGTCLPVPVCNTNPCEGDIQQLSEDGCNCTLVEAQTLGCMDVTACNYNEAANCDDGTCLSVPVCNTDPCGGDITQLSADQCSCEIVEQQVLGCTNAMACNYNASANCDDGSCILGNMACTDPCNEVLGCTDASACNYNPLACIDDGSCSVQDCAGVCNGTAIPGAPCIDANGEASTYADDCSCPPGCIGNVVIFSEDFINGLGSFSFESGPFSNSQSVYEYLFPFGDNDIVELAVGGTDNADIYDMSVGISSTFTTTQTNTIIINLTYEMVLQSPYEPDEFSEVRFMLNGAFISNDDNIYLSQIFGNGNGGDLDRTGVQNVSLSVNNLPAGNHTFTLGLFVNKKTYFDEYTNLIIDKIVIEEACTGVVAPTDTDGDGVPDDSDNCVFTDNTNQADSDSDGVGNVCDDTNGNCTLNSPCAVAENPCVTNGTYNNNCECIGTEIDQDNDGVCAALDPDDQNECIPNVCIGEDCVLINSENFEAGFGIWNDGGVDCTRFLNEDYANSGSRGIRIRDNSGSSSSLFSDVLDFSSFNTIDIGFSYLPLSMEPGEDFLLELSTDGGNSYTTVKSWSAGIEFTNGTRYYENETVSLSFSNNTRIRFRCDASSNGDRIYIDDIVIQNCTGLDTDGDDVPDELDNCVFIMNTNQADSDEDGIGNACDETNGNCMLNAPCISEEDPCISNGIYNNNCECVGTLVDADNDGVCSVLDPDDTDECNPNLCNEDNCIEINSEDFENGLGIWNDGGSDCFWFQNEYLTNSGIRGVRLRDNSGRASSLFSDVLNLSNYNSIELSFSFIALSMEPGEDFLLEVSGNGGSSYTTVKSWRSGAEFNNGTRYEVSETITANLTGNTRIRLRCDASSNGDRVYIDDIVIKNCGSSPKIAATHFNKHNINLFPNPAASYINIDISKAIDLNSMKTVEVSIYSTNGKMVYNNNLPLTEVLKINVSHLTHNLQYLVTLTTENEKVLTTKFIKM